MSDMPNLLYIHSDQHSPFVLGCYGDKLGVTPNLDKLATQGVVFENAYCSSPICGPSRMSTLTGRYPFENRCWTNRDVLDSGIPTIAHAMGAAGYWPVLSGRMHSIGPDQLRGYAYRLVGDHSPNFPGGGPVCDREALNGTAGPGITSLKASGAGLSGYEVHDEDVTDATVNYLNKIGMKRRINTEKGISSEPFSITVGLMLPHPPYVARKSDYEQFQGKITKPNMPKFYEHENPKYLQWWYEYCCLSEANNGDVLRARTAYWALVYSMDRMIGKIFKALKTNGLDKNTLIVYTSDHGDMLGEQGLFWKHTFYESSVRVPLIISWPDVISGGKRKAEVVSSIDVTASILDAMGAPSLPGSSGKSFIPLLINKNKNHKISWDNVAYSEYCSDEQWAPDGGCYQRMIRINEWKLVYYHEDSLQLFNLIKDPEERENLAFSKDYSSVKRELLSSLLREWKPEQIILDMCKRKEENILLEKWAQQVNPESKYLWEAKSSMFYLD